MTKSPQTHLSKLPMYVLYNETHTTFHFFNFSIFTFSLFNVSMFQCFNLLFSIFQFSIFNFWPSFSLSLFLSLSVSHSQSVSQSESPPNSTNRVLPPPEFGAFVGIIGTKSTDVRSHTNTTLKSRMICCTQYHSVAASAPYTAHQS